MAKYFASFLVFASVFFVSTSLDSNLRESSHRHLESDCSWVAWKKAVVCKEGPASPPLLKGAASRMSQDGHEADQHRSGSPRVRSNTGHLSPGRTPKRDRQQPKPSGAISGDAPQPSTVAASGKKNTAASKVEGSVAKNAAAGGHSVKACGSEEVGGPESVAALVAGLSLEVHHAAGNPLRRRFGPSQWAAVERRYGPGAPGGQAPGCVVLPGWASAEQGTDDVFKKLPAVMRNRTLVRPFAS